jgi:ribosomal protein S18 acetylase RimI-like enzyme
MATVSPGVLRRMQDAASRMWPAGCRWTAGELAWALLTSTGEPEIRFSEPGWTWLEDGTAIIVADDPAAAAAAIEALPPQTTVQASDGDAILRHALCRAGYQEVGDAPFSVDMRLTTARASEPVLPDGYLVRSAAAGDDLLGAHRAAWRPADLPFAPGSGPPLDPLAASPLTTAMLAAVQDSWPYRRDLHVVAQGPGGGLAASCIAWLDPTTGVAAIEPLGVSPGHRRRGLAGALCLHAARLVHAAGGDELVIHPRGDAAYPAPRGAYRRCGFAEVGRTRTYARPSGLPAGAAAAARRGCGSAGTATGWVGLVNPPAARDHQQP